MTTDPREQDELNKIQQLRVAQAELSAGNTRGQVYLRLSPGAVAYCADRATVQARVRDQLQQAIERATPPEYERPNSAEN